MPLQVNFTPDTLDALTFTFVVPGHQRWALRSVRAVCARATGGTPNRSYALAVTNGTSTVVAVPAGDAGDEPGIASITWIDADPSVVAAGADGVIVAPLAPLSLPGGYVIVGTILNPAAGDSWAGATAWYDYSDEQAS